MNFFRKHMRNNSGDANVSKMTLIAIVFVVGAILLVLTTSAFRGPINRWFSSVTHGWFADENGEFNLMIDPYTAYERNTNGTYKDLQYICYHPGGGYSILVCPEFYQHGQEADGNAGYMDYRADGTEVSSAIWIYCAGTIEISADGKTVTVDGDIYEAQLPK